MDTNNTFGWPKIHSKTHSQYSIYIAVFFLKISLLISPEHQDHLQNYFEPSENCFQIIQTEWTTNNTFRWPKIHSKTHWQYTIQYCCFLQHHIYQSRTSRPPSELFWTQIYIYCYFPSQISLPVSPEHQDHIQNDFEPPDNCFQISLTKWTTNNTFGWPKIHSKTHSQYSIYIAVFFLKFHF